MTSKLLPLAAMEKVLKNVDPTIRVSDKAKSALKAIIEEKAEKIAINAVKLAQHAGRKTIKADDVKLAAKG